MKYYQQKPLYSRRDWESVPWVRRVEADADEYYLLHVFIPWWYWRRRRVLDYIEEWKMVGIRVIDRPCWW
jgi:hypothetical protein